MPDPAQMSDDELDEAINNPPSEEPEEPETDNPEEGAPEEEPESEPEQTPEEEPEEPEEPEGDEEEEPAPPEPKISRREALRVRDLLAKGKQPEQEAPAAPSALDYEKALEADPETIKRLEADRQKVMQETFDQGLSQARSLQFHTRLEIDAPRVEAKYPQLDANNPESYKQNAAFDINSMYLALTGYDKETGTVQNPDLRYSAFVDTIFTLAKDIASEETQKTAKNVARQRAKTGLRPDGSTPKRLNLNKAPEAMTDEELDAIIAQAVPTQ